MAHERWLQADVGSKRGSIRLFRSAIALLGKPAVAPAGIRFRGLRKSGYVMSPLCGWCEHARVVCWERGLAAGVRPMNRPNQPRLNIMSTVRKIAV